MDNQFIRQQTISKLEEFKLYYKRYIENVEKETANMALFLSEESKEEMKSVVKDLQHFDEKADEIIDDIQLVSVRLSVLYQEYLNILKTKKAELRAHLTIEHEGITIVRVPLTYSTFASSAGYDVATSTLDIEYSSGHVYRYKNVPKEFYEKMSNIKSMKGLRIELDKYEYIKIK